ncbi:unnamed protein product, partial [marine sediment metagenome]
KNIVLHDSIETRDGIGVFFPDEVWPVLKELFYEHFASAKPNKAHYVLARLEQRGALKMLITQNIDNLQIGGNTALMKYRMTLASNPRIFILFLIAVIPPALGILILLLLSPIAGLLIIGAGIYFGYLIIRFVVSQLESWVETSEGGIKANLPEKEIISFSWGKISLAGFCSPKHEKPFLFVYESEGDKLLTIHKEYS